MEKKPVLGSLYTEYIANAPMEKALLKMAVTSCVLEKLTVSVSKMNIAKK